jgi:hypothetical protein
MHLTIKTAREHIADQLTEVRQDLRDTVGMLARVLGQPAVPVALPAPPEAILAYMEEDALVPLVREGEGSDAHALTSSRDRRTALALSLFLGLYGADRFYLGYHAMGWFKLFTAGGFLVLWIKDYRRLVEGTLPDSDGLPLARD